MSLKRKERNRTGVDPLCNQQPSVRQRDVMLPLRLREQVAADKRFVRQRQVRHRARVFGQERLMTEDAEWAIRTGRSGVGAVRIQVARKPDSDLDVWQVVGEPSEGRAPGAGGTVHLRRRAADRRPALPRGRPLGRRGRPRGAETRRLGRRALRPASWPPPAPHRPHPPGRSVPRPTRFREIPLSLFPGDGVPTSGGAALRAALSDVVRNPKSGLEGRAPRGAFPRHRISPCALLGCRPGLELP
jgi:hypothetical protein